MVATFHLHYLGHRIKYGNLEVGNTTQQLLSTTRPCCSIEFIESFLFWVILVIYNIGIYICIYIYKVSYIYSFYVGFNCNFFLHCMLNILRYEKIFCEIDESIASWPDPLSDMIFLGVYSKSIFSFMEFFFSRKLYFLWSPCLLLITESISLDASSKPTLGFFLKITSPSWIILSILLDKLSSINWLLKSWRWIFFKFYFIGVKKFGSGKKY